MGRFYYPQSPSNKNSCSVKHNSLYQICLVTEDFLGLHMLKWNTPTHHWSLLLFCVLLVHLFSHLQDSHYQSCCTDFPLLTRCGQNLSTFDHDISGCMQTFHQNVLSSGGGGGALCSDTLLSKCLRNLTMQIKHAMRAKDKNFWASNRFTAASTHICTSISRSKV